ncbi:MAG TPA: hypothetical protein VFF54_00245 [Thermodesulfobacteriota bacterium]|nr:hypothetical protein [Thermodesulfobacteriota bacterium]
MSNGKTILNDFVEHWKNKFKPKKAGKKSGLSDAWSNYLRNLLEKKFGCVIYECAFPLAVTKDINPKHRLDAAVWSKKDQPVSPMDIAIEWQWDFGKADKFVKGDFLKVLYAPAKAGLAIVSTRSAQKSSLEKAEKFIKKMKKKYANGKRGYSVGVIEVRKIRAGGGKKKYQCYFYDFLSDKEEALQKLTW